MMMAGQATRNPHARTGQAIGASGAGRHLYIRDRTYETPFRKNNNLSSGTLIKSASQITHKYPDRAKCGHVFYESVLSGDITWV